jgi:hypothetical protein
MLLRSDRAERTMTRLAGIRPRSMSRYAIAGLAVGGAAFTGVAPSESSSGDATPSVTTIERFDLSWQVAEPAPAPVSVEEVGETEGTPPHEHRQVRSDVAYVNEALADIDLTAALTIDLAYEGADGERIDVPRIQDWLEGRNSPMAPYAEELITAGIDHDVDPRLVVGIAAIESSVGKRLPPGSHNAWGWNGSGAYGLKAWPSWPEAIDDYTEGLARVYDTDNVDETMARKYVPPNWEKWLRTVHWVMDDI